MKAGPVCQNEEGGQSWVGWRTEPVNGACRGARGSWQPLQDGSPAGPSAGQAPRASLSEGPALGHTERELFINKSESRTPQSFSTSLFRRKRVKTWMEHAPLFLWFSFSVHSMRPHGPQHARPPCPSPSPRVYSNSCPSSQWCHPTVSSSVAPFSSCPPQSFPGIFPIALKFFYFSKANSAISNTEFQFSAFFVVVLYS